MKKRVFIITVIILLVTTSGIIYYYSRETNTDSDSSFTSVKDIDNSVMVTAILVKKDTLVQYINTNGTFKAAKKVELAVQIEGEVENVNVKEGDHVSRGDTLILINRLPYKLAYEKCRSAFLKSLGEFIQELKLKNSQNLSKWDSYFQKALTASLMPEFSYHQSSEPSMNNSTSEYLTIARYNLPSLYADLIKAEYNLSACAITAPFSGIISGLKIVKGIYLHRNESVLTLTNLDTMNLEIEILEDDLEYINRGKSFRIVLPSGRKIQGTIAGIDPSVDKEKHTGKAYSIIPNPENIFKDGQFIPVQLEKRVLPNCLLVPVEALLNRNDRDLVFKVENGLAKWQYVRLGERNQKFFEITSGISEGDTVIVEGHYSLAHDTKVRVNLTNR